MKNAIIKNTIHPLIKMREWTEMNKVWNIGIYARVSTGKESQAESVSV